MPTVLLGPMSWLPYAWPGQRVRVSLPKNALLTDLVLGVIRSSDNPKYRWLRCGCRTLVYKPLQLEEEKFLGTIVAPAHDGGSDQLSVPDGSVVSAIEIVDLYSLSIWYRQYIGPADFKLGPERPGIPTKEPRSQGDGNEATVGGCTMTGFQLQKDPDQTLAIKIMYRPVL
jgi:hypothetical protein